MKMRWACLLLVFPLTGCMAEVLTATAVQGQLQAQQMQGMKRQLDNAKGFSAETEIKHAISAYQAEKGALPPSLESLVPEFLPRIPPKADGTPYGYDPATGALLEEPLASGNTAMTPEDWKKLDQIRGAIQQYGTDTTWYPATLSDLVPRYLPEYPVTVGGGDFVYDNQTGEVYPPSSPAPRPVVSRPVTGGGSSVMNETVGAIGIQQELGNMNQGGTNAAGSRGRENARGIGADHSDRQLNAIENLGL